jgi:quercetin dioxygenase-like cupin family protein
VEENRAVPPVSLVLQLSRILKLNMDELETEEDTQATKRRSKSHKKRVDSYAYTPLSKPGTDKHLRGYLVVIEPLTDHKGVEDNRSVPPVSLVLQLSRILKLNMDELETEEETQATKRRSRSHKKRVDSYAYTPLSKPGTNKHLRGYLVTIDALTEHKGVEYHHEGEEFVFVLEGGITIQVGENVSALAKGDSLHFNSALHHKLNNPHAEEARLLVVVYVP